MGKKRAEKRAEEARILEEMQAAMQAQNGENGENGSPERESENATNEKTRGAWTEQPKELHCKNCKTVLENGRCPNCGFHIYVPMDESKRKRIRLITGGVCLAIFLVIFICLKARG